MMMRKPPPLADWLLKRFVSGYRREALLGDLLEEYQAGRTPGWYWRETIVAVLVCARRKVYQLISHPRIRAVAGLAAQLALLTWTVLLSEEYRQLCPARPAALSGSIIAVTCVGATGLAIALVLRLSSQRRALRISRRPGVIRLSVAAFTAVGFCSGALSWASTTSCSPGQPACAPSSIATSCTHPDSGSRHR